VFYPYQDHVPLLISLGAGVLLTICSVLMALKARKYPFLLMGWCWFLGTLVPTIGVVQVGSQSIADRYMYIPSIGLFIIIVWGLCELKLPLKHHRTILVCSASTACLLCLAWTSLQLSYWQDSIRLFRHAVEVTTDNYVACEHLGNNLYLAGN